MKNLALVIILALFLPCAVQAKDKKEKPKAHRDHVEFIIKRDWFSTSMADSRSQAIDYSYTDYLKSVKLPALTEFEARVWISHRIGVYGEYWDRVNSYKTQTVTDYSYIGLPSLTDTSASNVHIRSGSAGASVKVLRYKFYSVIVNGGLVAGRYYYDNHTTVMLPSDPVSYVDGYIHKSDNFTSYKLTVEQQLRFKFVLFSFEVGYKYGQTLSSGIGFVF